MTFAVEPPYDSPGGTYWALVKFMYFGRFLYSESIPIEIVPTPTGAVSSTAAGRKRRI